MRIHPPRYQCRACGHVLRGQEFADAREACPVCGERNGRASWPNPTAQEAIDSFLSRDAVTEEEKVNKVLLAAVALERMAVSDSAPASLPASARQDVSPAAAEAVSPGVASWPEALGSRSEKEIETASRLVGLPDFPDRWKQLVQVAAGAGREGDVSELDQFPGGWLEALVIDGLTVLGEAQNQSAPLKRA